MAGGSGDNAGFNAMGRAIGHNLGKPWLQHAVSLYGCLIVIKYAAVFLLVVLVSGINVSKDIFFGAANTSAEGTKMYIGCGNRAVQVKAKSCNPHGSPIKATYKAVTIRKLLNG